MSQIDYLDIVFEDIYDEDNNEPIEVSADDLIQMKLDEYHPQKMGTHTKAARTRRKPQTGARKKSNLLRRRAYKQNKGGIRTKTKRYAKKMKTKVTKKWR